MKFQQLAPGATTGNSTKLLAQNMNCLGEAAAKAGRVNNFNLVRLIASLGVLISHSYALATGDAQAEPLRRSLGISLGSLCVVVFFLSSGYLVTGSLSTRGDLLRFVVSRIMRIFPALIVVTSLAVLGIGPLFTRDGVFEYFSNIQTWRFWINNVLAMPSRQLDLPGVFATNPYSSFVNGSLWSIPYELVMYGTLAIIWLTTCVPKPRNLMLPMVFVLVASTWILYLSSPGLEATKGIDKLRWLTPIFFTGSLFYLVKDKVPLRLAMAALAAVVFLGCAYCGPAMLKPVYGACLCYLTLYVVYAIPPVKWLTKIDYSYGVYIYAWLIQQIIACSFPGIGPERMGLATIAIAIMCAALSWHLLEQRSLRAVEPLLNLLKRSKFVQMLSLR